MCRERGGLVWFALQQPGRKELDSVVGEFGLHRRAVEEARTAHQRPKVSRYGDLLLVVLKAARYVQDSETVEFEEISVFAGPDFVVTIGQGETSVPQAVRKHLEDHPELLRHGSMAILYEIMDRVVEDYVPVADKVEEDIDEIETDVFGGNTGVSRRIYELSREVIRFERATKPLADAFDRLLEEDTPDLNAEERRALRDLRDHLLRTTE